MVVVAQREGPHWLSQRVAGVILAGGKNSRMGGADKALLTVNGETVLQRSLQLLRRCFPEVIVVSNQPQKYRGFDVTVTADEFPGKGPLAGIHAALGRLTRPYAFVVACDMPFLRIEPIAFLVERLRDQEAVIARWDGDIEPLHAIYATSLRDRMATALHGGSGAIRDFLPDVRAEYVGEEVMRTIVGAEESFRNVNTPEEAARFEVRIGGAPRRLPDVAIDAARRKQ
jgi:molybdopterin-guanine dinucleotide biosynthesis protein A